MTNSLTGKPAPAQGADARRTTSAAQATRSTEPVAGHPLRGLSLRLSSGLRFDNNALSSNQNRQRDVIVVMKPSAYLDARVGGHDVRVGYEADIERFLGISPQSHLNHKFSASGNLKFIRRLKSTIESTLEYGSDSPGDIGTRTVTGGEPDRWREHAVGIDLAYGRRIARLQFGLGFGVNGQRYLNNDQQARDFDQRHLTLSGRYNLGAKYAVVSSLSGTWTDYLDPLSTLASHEYSALAGLEWEVTAKTSGSIKFGLRHRDMQAPNLPSNGGFTWDARVKWAPKTYSQFTAYSSRDVSEGGFSGAGGSTVTITDRSGLIWRHGLSERMTFEASAERSLSGGGDGGEDDERMSYGAGLRYRFNRWVDVLGDWKYNSNSSQNPGADFEAMRIFIGFEAHLDHAFRR